MPPVVLQEAIIPTRSMFLDLQNFLGRLNKMSWLNLGKVLVKIYSNLAC